jgi:hypothetical protein
VEERIQFRYRNIYLFLPVSVRMHVKTLSWIIWTQLIRSSRYVNAAALFFYDYVIPFGDSREEVLKRH